MYNNLCLLVPIYLALFFVNVNASENLNPVNSRMKNYKKIYLSLEREWDEGNRGNYFSSMKFLSSRIRKDMDVLGVEANELHLDLASDMLIKSRDGSRVREQSQVIAHLTSVDIDKIKKLPSWTELRARYARLVMLQRGDWIFLRNPSLDNKYKVTMDSTISLAFLEKNPKERARMLEMEKARKKKLEEENKIAMEKLEKQVVSQSDILNCIEEYGPVIDRFMIDSFSTQPVDLKALREYLTLGRYSFEEQVNIIDLVKQKLRNEAGTP